MSLIKDHDQCKPMTYLRLQFPLSSDLLFIGIKLMAVLYEGSNKEGSERRAENPICEKQGHFCNVVSLSYIIQSIR